MLSVVMYFIGGLLISLSAATIFVLAFETPFTRVEKILVRSILFSFSQHITEASPLCNAHVNLILGPVEYLLDQTAFKKIRMQKLSVLQCKWHV